MKIVESIFNLLKKLERDHTYRGRVKRKNMNEANSAKVFD